MLIGTCLGGFIADSFAIKVGGPRIIISAERTCSLSVEIVLADEVILIIQPCIM